jgi:hypothetical protein
MIPRYLFLTVCPRIFSFSLILSLPPLSMEQPSVQQLPTPKGEFCEPPSLAAPILSSGYTISPDYIDMVQEHPFSGWDKENPYHHLRELEQVYWCPKISGMRHEALKWKLFPLSLIESAKQWYTVNVRSANEDWNNLRDRLYLSILSTLPCLCLTSRDSVTVHVLVN